MRFEHWLDARVPAAPASLMARMHELVRAAGDPEAAPADGLVTVAEQALDAVLTGGCLTRASALELLAVDALVTYALEAAAADPETLERRATEAMARLARVAAAHDA